MHWHGLSAPDLVGLCGAGLILFAYGMSQAGRLDPKRPAYSAINLVGAATILFSLAFVFNLPAAVIESAWLVISAFGLVGALHRRGRGR